MKLIKFNDNYLVVSDDPVKDGDYGLINRKTISNVSNWGEFMTCNPKVVVEKITHSTKPLTKECKNCVGNCNQCVEPVPCLSLFDCQEIEYGFNIEDIADSKVDDVILKEGKHWNDQVVREPVYYGIIEGFNIAIKSMKDKLFTEWDVKFNENGKLVLI